MSRTGGGKEVLSTAAVVVGVGVGVAAFAGLGLAGAFGAGVLNATAIDSFTARRVKPALQPEDVRRDEQGRIEKWLQLLKSVQNGGVAPELRAELWPLLLGIFPHSSTREERTKELEQLRRLYIKLVLVCRELDGQLQVLRSSSSGDAGDSSSDSGGLPAANGSAAAGDRPPESVGQSIRSEAGSASVAAGLPGSRKSPLPLPGNLAAFAEAHRIIVMDAVRTDLRRMVQQPNIGGRGGACPGGGSPTLTILPVAVGDGLPELMMVGPLCDPTAPSSQDELVAIAADPGVAATGGRLPRWCSALAHDMIWGATHLDGAHRHQMLRLVNILSAYSVHDPETGYCQGMSDLASVFVQLFDDDALAFACFERLMRSARRNFKHDETGIRHQLQQIARVLRDTDPSLFRKLQQLGADDCMFAYRMVVVMLRRELPPVACCTLWEMQWAHEAADAEAAGAMTSSSSRASADVSASSSRASADVGASSSSSVTVTAAAAAVPTVATGLRSTVQGLSEATACARAAVALAQRPGSACMRQGNGRVSSAALAADAPPEFVLQFIASVVRAQRARIMSDCREHDDVLRLFNNLQIEFWPAVAQARKQHKAYVSLGAASTLRVVTGVKVLMATLKGPEIEQEARKEGAGEPLAGAPHQERQQPPALLALPDFLLTLILDHLTLASDLSSAAATCSVLRELANTTHWRHIGSFVANSWAPGMPGSLRWAAGQCPQLRHLDISGACACCDADLLPLAQLFTLTSLQLAGLWRIQGSTSSGSNGSSGRRRSGAGAGAGASSSPALDVLAAILGANRDLLTLDLSGTAVPIGSGLAAALAQLRTDTPNATRAAYGMQQLWLAGCQRAAGDAGDVLRDVLLKCLALTSLDLSGCRWITAETLPQDDDARSFALELLPLRHMSFAGCERLSGIGWLLSRWEYLETVDLSGTAVDDADVQAIARRCPWLHSVNLSGCIRIKGPALLSLATSMAVQAGILTELRIADLAWVSPEHLASLLQRCMHGGARKSVLRLDLSGCGGLNNDSLLALVPLGAVVPWLGPETPGDAHSNGNDSSSDGSSSDTATRSTSFCIEELRLAGSSRLTAVGLLQLVQASNRSRRTLLHGMCHLDVSHVQCLGSKAASSDTSTSAAQTLSALLEAAGSSLRILAMDGCFAGAGLVPTLVHCCHNVESLSLVGCTGLGDAELGVLTGLHKLRDLAVGGASLAWHEHPALTGLSSLTRLRIARRPFLTDAQLAPLLVTNRGSLVQLELAGCAALTDAVLLHLLPGHAVEWQGQQEEQAQPEVDAGSRRAQQLRQQRQQQRLSLRALQLVCCDRLIGSTLRHLVCLRSLRLNGCPCISGVALQAAAICCTQLTLLELPNHVPRSVVPVVPAGAASPLLGLQVLGGAEERGGARVCVCVDGGGEASEPLRTLKRCVSTAV